MMRRPGSLDASPALWALACGLGLAAVALAVLRFVGGAA